MCHRGSDNSCKGPDRASLAAGIGLGFVLGLLAGRWTHCTRCASCAGGRCRRLHCRKSGDEHRENAPANET